ncbi:hypothetical protein ACFL03_15390 [Thermodesulfobacteriota bacterium]
MKHLLTFVFLFTFPAAVFATQQMPDIIQYEGKTCELATSWEYPSPLEVYFRVSGKKYPFEELHTANYRGHVATWELSNNTLYLVSVSVEKKKIDLAMLFQDKDVKNKINASWFTGIAWVKTGKHKKEYDGGTYSIAYENYVFLRFKQGKKEKKVILTDKEYWKALGEYFERRDTDNPVKDGVIFEYMQYINSFREKQETHNTPDPGSGK